MSVGMVEEAASVVLILRAPEQARILIMEVGLLEGRAIALLNEGIQTPRPLTHELLGSVIEQLGAEVTEVHIREFKEKTFFANLVLTRADGTRVEVDARPSDAIALALRNGAPIYASDTVMEVASIEEAEVAADEEDDLEPVDVDDEEEEDEDGGGTILH